MLKERMKNKEKMVGCYIFLSNPVIARITALAGYDALWIDTEHSYMSNEDLLNHITAIRTTDTPVLVRAPQNDLTATKRILEMGVDGIIFPMIRTVEEAKAAVRASLYPPYGERGFGPMNAINYGYTNLKDYFEEAKKLSIFIQLEHKDAIDCLDELVEIKEIDGFIFGPNDLSGSYGIMGEVFSETITDVITAAIEKLHAKGKYAIIASGGFSEKVIEHWSSLGADMVFAGADFDFIRDGAVRNRENLERIHKKN
jgi:2-dehydro-3-deoxyglucarate aldolase/4-hydroxy-2-oxoheptanedioate aldolase